MTSKLSGSKAVKGGKKGSILPGGKDSSMQRRSLFILVSLLLAAGCGLFSARAWASSSFTITATNVIMPASGNGSSTFKVTNIPLTGTLTLSCIYSGTKVEARVPICPMSPPVLYQVTAGGTLSGNIAFYPWGVAIPASLHRTPHRSGYLPAAGMALSGALLLTFGLRRRARRWLTLAVLAAATLTGLAGMSACGGSRNSMTPGTYSYVISAMNESSGTAILGEAATTTISVTVQ
jgi:hypothetical protein